MAEHHVIDTNVLIVASAADATSPFQPDATPVQEAALRQAVLDWLIDFESSNRHLIVDYQYSIPGEYMNKLTEQDYGFQVFIAKQTHNQVTWVNLEFDEDGHAHLAPDLAAAVHDRNDRKMVAAVLEAGGRSAGCNLVNACDTDWLPLNALLAGCGVDVQELLPAWVGAQWQSKHSKPKGP